MKVSKSFNDIFIINKALRIVGFGNFLDQRENIKENRNTIW